MQIIHSDAQVREEDLQAYVDGRLDVNRRAAVEAYLALHPGEAARINDYRAQNVALHHAFDFMMREPLPVAIDGMASKLATAGRERRSRHWLYGAASGVALSAAVAIGWFAHGQWSAPPVPATNPMASLTDGAGAPALVRVPSILATAEMHKGAIAGDALVGWLLQQSPASFRTAPDLKSLGLYLAGGRIFQAEGRTVLQLVYQNRQQLISLYVGPAPKGGSAAGRRLADGAGLSTASWLHGDMEFTLVGPVPSGQIATIAQYIQAQSGMAPQPGPASPGQVRAVSSGAQKEAPAREAPGVIEAPPAAPVAPSAPPEVTDPAGAGKNLGSAITGSVTTDRI